MPRSHYLFHQDASKHHLSDNKEMNHNVKREMLRDKFQTKVDIRLRIVRTQLDGLKVMINRILILTNAGE